MKWLLLALALAAGLQTWRLASEQRDHAQTRAKQAEVEGDRLRESLREIARLITELKGAQDAYNLERGQLVALRTRLAAAEQRLRQHQAEFDARLATASAESLRRYAAHVDGDLTRCRADVERFGLEAAACAAAAHTLKRNLDAMP